MRSSFFSLLATAASAIAFPQVQPRGGCGMQLSDDKMAAVEQHVKFLSANSSISHPSLVARATPRVIDVYWHVLYNGFSSRDPELRLTRTQINANIAALNSHYSSTPFSFRLANVTEKGNEYDWTHFPQAGSAAEKNMKIALRQGSINALNIYSTKQVMTFDGYSSYPWDMQFGPYGNVLIGMKMDGVVINTGYLVGAPLTYYGQGKTLSHHVGHWMGLMDIFQGGCSGYGDSVDDTPPQRYGSTGCPTSQDSCAGGGVDLIHNYMDTSSDPCRTSFTPGQITRAQFLMASYRAIVTW